jgi:DNA-binding MarR family transcriptional regulator
MPDARACAQLLLETVPNLMRTLGGAIRQQRPHDDEGATMGQFRMLEMLGRQPHTLSELAAIHHVTPSTMSRSVDLLVRRGWVIRQSHPDDRRQVLLHRSAAGTTAHEALLQQAEETTAQLLEQLDDAELRKLYDGLGVLQNLLRLRRNAPDSGQCHSSRE